jgi:outer membrane protein assembly factor BamE
MPQLEITGRTRLMLKILISIATIATLLGACSSYRLDVQQGNAIEDSRVAQLREGMTPQQVQFLLGSPQVRGTFLREDRWDYVFFHAPSRGQTVQRRVSVFFDGGRVARIEDTQPPLAVTD